jgi:hypothetical protein
VAPCRLRVIFPATPFDSKVELKQEFLSIVFSNHGNLF